MLPYLWLIWQKKSYANMFCHFCNEYAYATLIMINLRKEKLR